MNKSDANASAAAFFYKDLLSEIKGRVQKAQNRLATVANTELLALYLTFRSLKKYLWKY